MPSTRRNSGNRGRRVNSSMDQSMSAANSSQIDGLVEKTISPTPQNEGASSSQRGRRRHRRAGKGGEKHRRKWKPYDKLSWEEKRLLSEKEAVSAEKRREQALRQGHPVAPFNTTQFIMEEHSGGKGITPRMITGKNLNSSGNHPGSGQGSGFCSQQDTPIRDDLGDDTDIYFEREYTAALETVRAERLQSLNASQLRTEVLRLELEIDSLKRSHQSTIESKDREISELRNEIQRQNSLLGKFAELVSETKHSGSNRQSSSDQDYEPLSPKAS